MLLSSVHKTGEPHVERFELALDEPIAHWGQEYRPMSPLCATIEASYTGERILARVAVKGEVSLPCSRCLADTRVEIFGELRYLFSLRAPMKEHDPEDDDDPCDDGDVDVIMLDSFQSEISFADQIWEVLMLSLPEGALCRPDCKGLCRICGRDLNAGECGCSDSGPDPRFSVLMDMMERDHS